MPSKKKQKTSDGSGATTSSSADCTKRDIESIPPFEYICIFRPLFDFKNENYARDDPLEDIFKEYKKEFDEKSAQKLYPWPAADNPDWKWIMQWKGFQVSQDLIRRASYCSPDSFGMYLYNDWEGYGLRELIENSLIEFNTHIVKKPTEETLQAMWATMSGMGLWLNQQEMGPFVGNEDGERVCDCYGMIGCAVVTALNALDIAGELKADSKFQDLALVISLFLTWSDGLEDYGVEEDEDGDQDGKWFEDVSKDKSEKSGGFDWRKQVAAYAKKAGVDPTKGAFGTDKLLEKYEQEADTKTPWEGRWRWSARWKAYNKRNKPTVGGHQYDITRMSRKERAKAAYDGKDPLAGIPAKDLKEGNLYIQ